MKPPILVFLKDDLHLIIYRKVQNNQFLNRWAKPKQNKNTEKRSSFHSFYLSNYHSSFSLHKKSIISIILNALFLSQFITYSTKKIATEDKTEKRKKKHFRDLRNRDCTNKEEKCFISIILKNPENPKQCRS